MPIEAKLAERRSRSRRQLLVYLILSASRTSKDRVLPAAQELAFRPQRLDGLRRVSVSLEWSTLGRSVSDALTVRVERMPMT